jgi:hypothetical protein
MSDRTFEFSLTLLAVLVLLFVTTAIVLTQIGFRWLNVEAPLLMFLSVLIGLVVIIVGGIALLYLWGKSYMARG